MWNIKHTMLNGAVVQAGSDTGAEWFIPGETNPIFGPVDMVQVKTPDLSVQVTINEQGRVVIDVVDRLTDLRIAGMLMDGHKVRNIEFGENE